MLRHRNRLIIGIVLGVALVALSSLAAFGSQSAGSTSSKDSVELTIYNSNLALIKERRTLEIPTGVSTVLFGDITSEINPATVSFLSLTSPAGVTVREQNYEYDLVEDTKLLQKFIGEKIAVTTRDGQLHTGYLLSGARGSSAANIVMSQKPDGQGEISTIHLGDIQSVKYPGLPEGLITKPTLAWLISNTSGSTLHDVLVTYLTGGLSWSADYVAVIGADDDTLDLRGWVTIDNKSGATFKDAKLKLVAGDVNRAKPENDAMMMRADAKVLYAASAPSFEEKAFADYHLYTMQFPTTIKNNQVKQVELLSGTGIPAKKLLIFDGEANGGKVSSILEFWNKAECNLGMPLPKGIIRVSKMDSDGSLEFVGEDRIDHTPKDEKVRIQLGSAFDVVGSRTQTNTKTIGSKVREESYKIEIRNRKDTPVDVTVIEHMRGWGEWEITGKNTQFAKTDSQTIEFQLNIAPGGTGTVTYTVRYTTP